MRNFKKGFTLIEILLVVAIIGALVGILAIRASDVGSDAKKKAVAADLKSLKAAVEVFFIQNSEFPEINTWEAKLVEATPRLIDEVPADPYKSTGKYTYMLNTDDPAGTYYVIFSVGPDGTTANVDVKATDNGTVTILAGGLSADNLWVSNCFNNNHKFD